MKKGHIFFISWFAWSGKGTVIESLNQANIADLKTVISWKTREPRSGEVVGRDYHKLSFEDFKIAIDAGEFLEYNFVHGQNYYGTKYSDVMDGLKNGKKMLKEMDITILPELLETKPELREDFSYIFLDIPETLIKQRMELRGDDTSGEDFQMRMISAKKERSFMHLADYIIDGSRDKKEVFEEIKNIIINK